MGDANAANFRYLNHFFEVDRAQSTAEVLTDPRAQPGHPVGQHDRRRRPRRGALRRHLRGPQRRRRQGAALRQRRARDRGRGRSSRAADPRRLDAPPCAGTTTPTRCSPASSARRTCRRLFRDDYVTNSNDSLLARQPAAAARGLRPRSSATSARRARCAPATAWRWSPTGSPHGGFTKLSPAPGPRLQRPPVRGRAVARRARRDVLGEPGDPVAVQRPGRRERGVPDPRGVGPSRRPRRQGRAAVPSLRQPRAGGPPRPASTRANPFATPFDAADPVNTPRGLERRTAPRSRQALADAVSDLARPGIPLDAPLRGYQYEQRGDEQDPDPRRPRHAGRLQRDQRRAGTPEVGYPDVPHGSSFIQAVALHRRRLPATSQLDPDLLAVDQPDVAVLRRPDAHVLAQALEPDALLRASAAPRPAPTGPARRLIEPRRGQPDVSST